MCSRVVLCLASSSLLRLIGSGPKRLTKEEDCFEISHCPRRPVLCRSYRTLGKQTQCQLGEDIRRHDIGKAVGLNMNPSKTKTMRVNCKKNYLITVGSNELEDI